MRLKTIKLAGFKSFVDPTTVNLVSNMCAVVGPNGCGKSNIIDAVRWVMGESSAKNLRGEAMTDVIFNGSGSRKPVGQASIELVFDNSDGTVTGEYAGYNEISIKRRVTRDGQNLYYLNGNRCRRRDITDIFLGTGLGPRSYAIIEQGMISRLIEAKPEELRVYIEEAAGISKYKERRKETESRMRRTQENLERLTDLREELERQLVRLERQAKAAEKFSQFKKEERELNAKHRAIRLAVLRKKIDVLKTTISEHELAVEAAVTQRVKHDAAIEKHRSEYTEKSDKFNEVQGQYYAVGGDIARIEQSIQHAKERESSLRRDIEQNQRDVSEAREHLSLDEAKIEGWQAELEEMSPELEGYESVLDASREALVSAEDAMHDWQQRWDSFNQRAAGPKQAAEVQQSRIQYLEQVQQRLNQRRQSIKQDLESIEPEFDSSEIEEAEAQALELEMQVEEKSASLTQLGERIVELREQQDTRRDSRDDVRQQLQTSRGRLASLEALQNAALGKENKADIEPWLASHGLAGASRLGESIEVSTGWEAALETVLGDTLQAVLSADDLGPLVSQISNLDTSLEIARSSGNPHTLSSNPASLWEAVSSPVDLSGVLSNIKLADDLEQAASMLAGLSDQESIVTREGYWLSKHWIKVKKAEGSEAGVLARQSEIESLQASIEELSAKSEQLDQAYQSCAEELKSLEQQRELVRKEFESGNREAQRVRGEISSKKAKSDQISQKKQRAVEDIAEIDKQLELETENLAEARATLEDAIEAIELDSEERESLLTERDDTRNKLDTARQKARHDQDKSHELQMRSRSVQGQLESMQQGMQRLKEQIARMEERRDLLQEQLEEHSNPSTEHELELEALLEKRVSVEQKLSDARREVEQTEHSLRESEKARNSAEQDTNVQRGKLEQARIELQAVDVRAQNIEQQLSDDDFEYDQVAATLTEEDSEENLVQELEQMAARIQRLGPINLAAIDEYAVESERKNYLDEQNKDLCEALETLEEAIKRIDKETRTRFKETYDKVNSGLQELFPKLFGGGHAHLELTGEDMLDTGIAIMARPPGKKNSTIHLLSGGEKALTAIALVFSIFHLNPAPFCMLDEVDAPLDDANVGRYAQMVEMMSEKVQFIYITHNKIAMERAQHLMGVTMQEAGVSRMVTVDVDEAAELAAI